MAWLRVSASDARPWFSNPCDTVPGGWGSGLDEVPFYAFRSMWLRSSRRGVDDDWSSQLSRFLKYSKRHDGYPSISALSWRTEESASTDLDRVFGKACRQNSRADCGLGTRTKCLGTAVSGGNRVMTFECKVKRWWISTRVMVALWNQLLRYLLQTA